MWSGLNNKFLSHFLLAISENGLHIWNYSCFCPLLYGTSLNRNNKGEQPMRCKQQSLIRNATESEEQKHVLVLHYQSEWKPLSVKAPLIFLPKGSLVFLPAYLCDCPYSACNARPVSQITQIKDTPRPRSILQNVRHLDLGVSLWDPPRGQR